MRTVFRWVKAFKAGKFSFEDDTPPGRPKTSVTKANIAAVKIVVEQDARLSVEDIASCTGISEGSVQTILKKRLDLRKVYSRWVPHLLTEEQKTQSLKCARELLKTYKGCTSRVISNLLTSDEKKVREKSRECHNHKPQPFPPKRKRNPTNLNKRTKSTKISSLFPKRGNRNTKRTEKHKNKTTHGKTYNKSPRRINHKATKSKTNTGTTALERSVEQTTVGFKALLQLANFTLGPDATLNTEIHKNSVRIKVPNSVNASKRKHKNQINHYDKQRRVLMANSTVCQSK